MKLGAGGAVVAEVKDRDTSGGVEDERREGGVRFERRQILERGLPPTVTCAM